MTQRVPAGWDRVKAQAPKIFDEICVQALSENTLTPRQLIKFDSFIQRNKTRPSRDLWYNIFLEQDFPKSRDALIELNWTFYVSNVPQFLTSDNPVINSGLNKPTGELCFPISSKVLLIVSHMVHNSSVFYVASSQLIEASNRRVVQQATKYVYHCTNAAWVTDLIKAETLRAPD